MFNNDRHSVSVTPIDATPDKDGYVNSVSLLKVNGKYYAFYKGDNKAYEVELVSKKRTQALITEALTEIAKNQAK